MIIDEGDLREIEKSLNETKNYKQNFDAFFRFPPLTVQTNGLSLLKIKCQN